MKLNLVSLLLLLLLTLSVHANLEVGLLETKASDNKALVSVTMKNSFAQPVKSARIWLVLLDGEGKIVGNKAQWLTGKDEKGKPLEKGQLQLEQDQQADFSVAVDTTRKVENVKLTFSRIVMADGSLADPRKNVVSIDAEKEE